MEAHSQAVAKHYTRGSLARAIEDALRQEGRDLKALRPEDLSPVDQFHSGGARITKELIQFGGIPAGAGVLDAGSGLGGPARMLALLAGCRVTGVDLTGEFCAVAAWLTALVGLAERVAFLRANALQLPFPAERFDAAWTMQAQMNIADKARFYGELYRVTRRGGRLVFQDLFQGAAGAVEFPVPWASDPATSFLVTPEAARAAMEAQGWRVRAWRDVSRALVEMTAQAPESTGEALPPLGMQLIQGENIKQKRGNSSRAMREGRLLAVQAVLEKPA
jgi:ubiquinone/menaquinone biosynthesis C-methylase UbiE